METFGVWYLVPVWCGTHPALHMEHGKPRIDDLGVLGIGGRIIQGLSKRFERFKFGIFYVLIVKIRYNFTHK